MKRKRDQSHCPISYTLNLVGDKWSLLVLRDLILRGKRHYKEFLRSQEGVSTNILADRLERLESCGLVSKANDPSCGRQVIYSPTRKGLDLVPLIFEMVRWGVKYDPDTSAPPELLRKLQNNEAALVKEIYARFDHDAGRQADLRS